MTLEVSIREHCAGIKSVRATDRKKNAEILKDFLVRNAAPSLLSENTTKKTGYTWNDVFDDINEYILKETEKFETTKNFDNVSRPLCANLLHLCIAGSNRGRSYVLCEKVMSACFFILKDTRLTKAIGDAYLKLLYKHVLPFDYYLGYITPTAWEDLLDVCISACLSKHYKLDDFTKMKLLWLVIKNGKSCCQFVIPLRDSLTRLKECFCGHEVTTDKKLQEIVIEIMIVLLDTLSSECRLTICEFAESIFPSILQFYDQNLDRKKKTSLFKLFQLMVMIHHPQGALQGEDGSLANNWGIWNKQLQSILEIICLEQEFLQKLRKQGDILSQISENYYYLAALVYFQIFNLSLPADDIEHGNASKRQKVLCNQKKTFNDIIEELGHISVPWIEITHVYIKNYGHTISVVEYLALISAIESLITNNTNNLNWDVLEEMTRMIIKNVASHSNSTKEDYDMKIVSLWNSCVRTSTLVNATHKALHGIMQLLLSLDALKYRTVQPLIKLYFEKGMPVTDDSLKTLIEIYHKFFNKCSSYSERMNFFSWMTQNIISLDVVNVRLFMLRLLASENFTSLMQICETTSEYHNIRDTLFRSPDKCILFSEFNLGIPKSYTRHSQDQNIEICEEMNTEVNRYLRAKLSEYTGKLRVQANDFELSEYIKLIAIVIAYFDIKLQCSFVTRRQVTEDEMFCMLKTALRFMFLSLANYLSPDKQIPLQNKLLQSVQKILLIEYDSLLNSTVRQSIDVEFFHNINKIINSEMTTDEAEYGEDLEMNPNVLRHHCICFLAAYCRKREEFRDEILKLIMEPTVYNFSISWDIDTAFACIELLNASEVEDPPLDSMFPLILAMCKDLFRNSKASYRILQILINMLDRIWTHDSNMRQNCSIMVKSYLQRCAKLFYPPHVAALIYECTAKIAVLNIRHNRETDNTLIEAIVQKIKGDIHTVRLYCCYLLKLIFVHQSDLEIESYLTSLMDIFVIKVSERNEFHLKDETRNRTLTILHTCYALAQTKSFFIHSIVNEVMLAQKDKSLDKDIVKKVLNKITNIITDKSVELYLNENILSVLYYWFSKNNTVEQLSLQLFGFDQLDLFIEKHMKWLIAADILWRKRGVVRESDVLKQILLKPKTSVPKIIEESICHIIVLCLPYVATEKYGLDYFGSGKLEWIKNANTMFQSTRQILGNDKWSSLFAENMSDLVTLTATHLQDQADAQRLFNVNIPKQSQGYQYPKDVYFAILKYIGALVDENIMQYLCENQSYAIFKALFELWKNVLQENTLELKVLKLHTYITFVEAIPLGHSTDTFVCNFVCNSFAHAIKDSQNKDEITVFVKALKIALEKYLAEESDLLRKSVSRILSILMIKKEEGFNVECASLMNYLTVDMKGHLKESEDVVDFISSMSQGIAENVSFSSNHEFIEKLKTYKKSLSCPSHETLINMRQFLKTNKRYVNKLSDEFNKKGFSDDCGTSIIHQVIHSLSNILKSASDSKTVIEACNCLSEIGNYDLKTLVTVPPIDTEKITDLKPKQSFAIVVMSALTDILFDESPLVTNDAARALKHLLKYREGNDAMDLEDVDKQMLIPFKSSNSDNFAEFSVDDMKFCIFCTSASWLPRVNETHSQWLVRITVALLDVLATPRNYINTLRVVCMSKSDVCRKILAPLLGLLLDFSSEHYIKMIGKEFNMFFKYIWDQSFDDKVGSSSESDCHKRTSNTLDTNHKMIVQYMLDIVNYVRLQRRHYKTRLDPKVGLNFLQLEYDKVAWAATVADQNLSAIYYGELWAVAQNDGVPPSSPEITTQLDGGENVQRIFRKCFVSIGEMDALDGCGTAHLTSEDEKRKHLINTGQFADALLLHDVALSCGQADNELQYGVVKSLHKSGMHHLALHYIKSIPENDGLNDIKYECLSFLGDWTDFVDTRDLEEKSKQTNCNSHSIIRTYRYSCLKDCLNLHVIPESKLVLPLNRAKLAVAKYCQNLNMENCQSVYKVLSKLHLFSDIEDYFSVRCAKTSIHEMLIRWQVGSLPPFNDFKHLESIISQRSLILEHAAKAYSNSLTNIVSLQLQYAELGLSNQRVQMAQRILAVVKKLKTSRNVALVDSQISWAKGHKDIALSLLRNIISNVSPDVKVTAISLRQYGMWMAESKCDNSRDIIDKYLKKSLEVLGDSEHEGTRLKVYYDIAKFADAEYNQVVEYMNSSTFEKKVQCLETMKDTACSLRSTQCLNKDERKALATNEKFGEIDEAEVASTRAEKETFLHLAMRYYLLSLRHGEANNLSVFRVISLWLDNPNIELLDSGEGSFTDLLHSIPSHKFIKVLPQLGPRLSDENSIFAENLKTIIKRCAIDHPHHTLPILFNLKNTEKDKQILNASGSGTTQRPQSNDPRILAVEALVVQLAAENDVLAVIIEQMEKICDATISFANYVPISKDQRLKHEIPAAELIHRLGHLDAIPIPTVTIPISNVCKYTYIPTPYSFENYFELVGGINCPKKIQCKSSDGKVRILLIKGEDDLRQDAVMQQVFNIVNTLLEKNPVTNRNKLLIRTYKVVPMSRRSGVLEWCEGTLPIGVYLTSNGGAHTKYRPRDMSPNAARAKLMSLQGKGKSNHEKLLCFQKILREFKPVFHYFFTEHYLDPVTWYERRLAYTKSVAASSMVGYILGLGDRHLQNILIDKNTAEVIHIDFGIAFDQGKTLPTPETIPFRLTQDIVAGFGPGGVEGIFRRCCEKTMQLLRDNQETLLTILEVLLCDPLYSWTVTSKQQNVLAAQTKDITLNQNSGSHGSLAKRALLTVSSKLSGTEGGAAGGVAVPGQVARLIHTAMDPANLCRVYFGWQPYL